MLKKRRQLLSVVAGTLAVLSFLILSSYAVVWANGLRFNPSSGSFDKTVLIAIESDRIDAGLFLNGEKITGQIPYRIRNLLPGTYLVELTKVGFYPWKKTFFLSEGQVGLITDPVLLADPPLITDSLVGLAPRLTSQLGNGLSLTDGELTDRGTFITRFSRSPLQVHGFNGSYLYQDGNELRLFIPAGTQDFLIYQATQADQLPIALFEKTWQVAVTDNNQVRLINLTIPVVSE